MDGGLDFIVSILVLDQSRTGKAELPSALLRLLHQLLVGHVSERTDFTNLATINDDWLFPWSIKARVTHASCTRRARDMHATQQQ
jgi:hypothetical protein